MTPAELANVLALPLSGVAWMGVQELTPSQLSSILAALATAGQSAHLQTGGGTPTANYLGGDGGAVASITGTDSAGTVACTIGTGFTDGDLVQVVFAVPFASTPRVTLTATNNSALVFGFYLSSVSNTSFTIHIPSATGAGLVVSYDWIAVGAPN